LTSSSPRLPVAETGVVTAERRAATGPALARLARLTFVRLGVLPLLLLILVIGFGIAEPRFLSGQNIFNVARQSTYLTIVAMASIGFGLALSMTGGVPVYGMPSQFGATLGFGKLLGVPVPVYVTVVVILGMYVLLNWTRIGRYFYAIGGNIKASALSGISTRSYLFLAYVLCGFLASLGGVMLTARLETGQAHIGAAMPLRSIAACLIGAARSRPRGVPAGTQAPGRGIPPRRAQPHARAGRGAGRGRGCRRRLGGGSGGAREARGQHAGRRSGDRDAGRGVRSRREGRAG